VPARRLRDEVDPYVVEVSLHGACAETHDRQTRVAGSFVRLLENVRELTALGVRVKVNSTLTRWNESEIDGMYAITDALGVSLRFDLQVSPRDNGDRTPLDIAPTLDGIKALMRADDRRYAAFAPGDAVARPVLDDEMPAPQDKHCGAGSAGIAIDPYGNIYPCVQWRRSVANLHETTIGALWGSAFDEIRGLTAEAKGVVAQHPRGRLLNFCPGLAEMLTGSPVTVPAEMEQQAEIVENATKG
jgi:MoaA/NifB/PqqE/SkfB family radical SAM enzyme